MGDLIEFRTPPKAPEWPPMAVCAACDLFGDACPGPCTEDFGPQLVTMERRGTLVPVVESMTAALLAGLTDREGE